MSFILKTFYSIRIYTRSCIHNAKDAYAIGIYSLLYIGNEIVEE